MRFWFAKWGNGTTGLVGTDTSPADMKKAGVAELLGSVDLEMVHIEKPVVKYAPWNRGDKKGTIVANVPEGAYNVDVTYTVRE
jgi:hypothetical protein